MRRKSETRLALEKLDLIDELQNYTIKGLAKKFSTTTCIIQSVLTNQLKVNFETKKRLAIDENCSDYEERMLRSKGVGVWMLSHERKSIIEYKNQIVDNNFEFDD